MKILFCGNGWRPLVDQLRARLPAGWTLAERDPRPLPEQLGDVDVVLPSNARFDAACFAAAPRLRLVQQPAVGIDGVDLEAARRHGVPVCNAPGANAQAVAEATLLLLLALARRLSEARAAFAQATIGQPIGRELRGSRLLLVGRGHTARAVASVTRALGLHVTLVGRGDDLLSALAAADHVSLHCPLTPETRGLLGDRELAALPRGANLVNVARGPIVDKPALEAALARGHLGGAGLDVFWDEPWDPGDPLYARPDVVTLPHIAGSTVESFTNLVDVVLTNLDHLRAGRPLLHQVTGPAAPRDPR